MSEPQTLRDVFGAEVGDKVCALPVVLKNKWDYEEGDVIECEQIEINGENCCILGAFLMTAAGGEKTQTGHLIVSYPDYVSAVNRATEILGRKLATAERQIIGKNIKEWDRRTAKLKKKRAAQVKRECAARDSEQGEQQV